MKEGHKVRIAGSGAFLPGRAVSIDEVDTYLGELTNAPLKIQQWMQRMKSVMRELLEVEYYHYAIDPLTGAYTEDNISMSVKAAQKALEMAGVGAEEVEFIAYGSAHQDQMPTASVRIQEVLGIERCGELSIHANCTSAYKALLLATDFISSGRYNNALVISSGISSSELRASYYNQPLIRKEEVFLRYFLCDGAGAVFLSRGDIPERSWYVRDTYMESAGGKKPSAMGNKRPAYWMNPLEEYENGLHHLAQMFRDELGKHFHEAGGSIFLHGLKRMTELYHKELSKVRYFQVNFPSRHISDLVMEECEQLGISRDKLYTSLSSMGYPGPPMALICLDKIIREEQAVPGDLVLSFVTEVSKFMQAGYLLEYS